MKPYSLDTSFLIDVLGGVEDARETMARLDDADRPAGVTPVAAAELQVGAHLGTAAELREAETMLDSLLWLDHTREAARRAGSIQARRKRDGDPLAFTDCLIAGATLAHGGTLVTRDGDFDRVDDLELLAY